MKRLYLIRHAKSSWDNPALPDFRRPLNKRGKQDAPVMGQRLANQRELPELIVSSPAVRALVTAQTIADQIGYPIDQILEDPDIYEGTIATLLHVVHGVSDSHERAALVGHNPGLTFLANTLGSTRIDNIPTCGVVQIDLAIARWQDVAPGVGTTVDFDYPKKS